MRNLFSKFIFAISLVSVFTLSEANEPAREFEPYVNDKIYLGFGFGVRLVKTEVFNTPVSGTSFIPDDSYKLSEQLVLGYDLCKFFGFEGQFTFFPSSVYFLTPNSDSIIRKVYAFSGLMKFMIPWRRVRFDFGVGGSIVYTLAPNFEIYVPNGIYAPPDDSNYIDGKWGHKDFFRPEYFAAIGFYASKRILISVIYSCIFGTGEFQATPKTFPDKDAEFFVNKNYLPDLRLIVLMITMKI